MDIVIEGKITTEEGMGDVIQTVIDLKNLPNALLRVTSADADLQGRIAFAQGGYILGGKINNTEETGYPAVRRLLSIRTGNYAILDPGRLHAADVNQTLWIRAAKVIELLPDLPESPQILLDADLDTLNPNQGKAQVPSMDLKVSSHSESAKPLGNIDAAQSKSRKFDAGNARMMRVMGIIFLALVAAGAIAHYWDQIVGVLHIGGQ